MSTILSLIPLELHLIIQSYSTPYEIWKWLSTSKQDFHHLKYEIIQFIYRFTIMYPEDYGKPLYSNLFDDPHSILLKLKNWKRQISLTFCEKNLNFNSLIPPVNSRVLFQFPIQLKQKKKKRNMTTTSKEVKDKEVVEQLKEEGEGEREEEDEEVPLTPNLIKELISHFTYYPSESGFPYQFHGNKKVFLNQTSENYWPKHPSTSLLLPFQGLTELNLSYCSAKLDGNLRILSHLQKLTLFQCGYLTDLTGLGKIPYLTIQFCTNITDLTPLTDNYSLIIDNCPKICKGYESLKNCIILDTDFIDKEYKLLFLKKVSTLTVTSYASGGDDILYQPLHLPKTVKNLKIRLLTATSSIIFQKKFAFLHSLKLWFIKSMENLENVYSIPVIEISTCPDLEDISSLGGNKMVKITSCQKITNFWSLREVPKVIIINCGQFTDCSEVELVKDLEIRKCPIKDVKDLGNVEILKLIDCLDEVPSLIGLENVLSLEIIDTKRKELFLPVGLGEGRNQKIVLNIDSSFLSGKLLTNHHYYDRYATKVNNPKQIVFLKKNPPPHGEKKLVD